MTLLLGLLMEIRGSAAEFGGGVQALSESAPHLSPLDVLDLPGALDTTNLTWTLFGPDQWVPTTSFSYDGVDSAVLTTTNLTGCGLQTVVTGPGTVKFWWVAGKARLTFMLDGGVRATGGSFGAQVLLYVPAGKHVLTWTANREGFTAGPVTAYVDAVAWIPGGTAPIVPTTATTNLFLAGTSAGLSAGANGTSPYQYQWLLNGVEIPFATNSTLSFTNAQAENQGVYSVVVSNPWGSVTRSNMVVGVTPSPPVLLTQPYHTNRIAGLPFVLTASARGSSPIIYQWKHNGFQIPGATNSSILFTNPQVLDSGGYIVEVSNALGSVNTANALVRVYSLDELAEALNAPSLPWTTTVWKPWFPQTNVSHDGVSAAQGYGETSVETTVTGPAVVTFWWKCSGDFTTFEAWAGGALQASIRPTADWQPGTVYVSAGSHTVQWKLTGSSSDPGWLDQALITPGGVPVTITKAPSHIATSAGSRREFAVVASGTPPFRYQWQLDGNDIAGETNSWLTVNAQISRQGTYTVVINNDYGPPASASANLQVSPAAPSVSTAWTNMARTINGTADFEVSVTGSEPLTCQWFFNDAPVPGVTNLVLTKLKAEDAGNYQIVVTNSHGSATSAVLRLVLHSSTVVEVWSATAAKPAQVLDVSNVVAVAAGTRHTAAIKSDGSVIAWGDNSLRQTEIPEGLQNVISIAAGDNHTVALSADGNVVCWGDNRFGQLLLPEGLHDVIKVAAARNHTLVLKTDGTLTGWGEATGALLRIPEGISNVVDITTIPHDGFVLKKDGTVRGWYELSGYAFKHTTNAVQVGAAGYNFYILKDDGVMDTFYLGKFPVQTPGVISISAAPYTNNPGGTYVVALLAAGDVQIESQSQWVSRLSLPRNLTNAVSVSAGQNHAAILLNDGSPFVSRSLLDKMAVAGSRVVFYPGISGQQPMSYQWYHEGQPVSGGTNLTLVIDPVRSGAAGLYSLVATNSLGIVTTHPAKLTVVDARLLLSLSTDGTPSAGLVRLVISGLSGRGPAVIYSSDDLVQWQPVCTNPPVAGMLEFIDTPEPGGQKFYRVLEE